MGFHKGVVTKHVIHNIAKLSKILSGCF